MDHNSFRDDLSIKADSQLWRRIPPWHFVKDENLGQVRPSSAAFENHPDGSPMSVLLGDEMVVTGRGPEAAWIGFEEYGIASISAGLARSLGQGVAREPLHDEPAHAVVFGEKNKRIRKKLALGSNWVVSPKLL